MLLSVGALRSNDLLLLFFMGVILNVGGYILFYRSLRHVKAQTAGIITSIEPIYGSIGALIILGEVPEFRTIIGGILIIITSLYATLDSKK